MVGFEVGYELQSSDMESDDRPIAVRRKRRNSNGSNILSSPVPSRTRNIQLGINTPPATPHRTKKRVRFSDPGPAIESTGLTPFVRRTSLGTPSTSRRHCTPSKKWNLAVDDTPISGVLQFEPLRQVLEGRVQRRLRRNRLSEELNIIESEKKQEGKQRRETETLRRQLREKDLEIANLREEQNVASQLGGEAGVFIDIDQDKVQELETQVSKFRAELAKRQMQDEEVARMTPMECEFDDDVAMPNFDDEFDDEISDIIISTPSRRAFLSPPVTAPTTPSKGLAGIDAMIQAGIADPEKLQLKDQLNTLEEDLQSLHAAIEITHTTHERLLAKLAPYSLDNEELDAALDKVLTDLALFQSSSAENSNRFSALSSELRTLGFSHSPEATIEALHAQFRSARIELERLNPGETPEGFENSKLLDLLVERIRVLTRRVQGQDSDIDQYHEQEISLRQQLGGRVAVMRAMEAALSDAQTQIMSLNGEVSDRDTNVTKLTRALEGYRNEVSNLEALVIRMEADHSKAIEGLESAVNSAKTDGDDRVRSAQQSNDILQASYVEQESLIAELELRLRATHEAHATLKVELDAKTISISTHGEALALRDARVTELRTELERVNTSLKEAHETIVTLRNENRNLETQVEGEKSRYKLVVEAMKEQLMSVIKTANGYEKGDVAFRRRSTGTAIEGEKEDESSGVVARAGQYLSGALARKSGSGKKRRRYDSGLGFLEEEDELEV